MRHPARRTAALAASLILALGAAPAVAGDGHRGGGHHGGDGAGPERIALPDGWRPEGIATDGRRLYVGSLADGALWVADPRTGNGEVLADGVPGRVAVGVEHDRRRDLLWVAGGLTGEVRAHDADTGDVVATYAFPSTDGVDRFLNDLVVTRHAVYVTDSRHAELAVVPLDGTELPAADQARVLALSGDLQMATGNNLNGIATLDAGSHRHGHRGHHSHRGRHDHHGALVAVQSNLGKLLRIDPRTGETDEVDLGGETLVNGDGLEAARGRLYVLRNRDNLVVPVRLHHRADRGTVEEALTDPDLDVPSTAAIVRRSLYAVNARFTTPATPETEYWIARVSLKRR